MSMRLMGALALMLVTSQAVPVCAQPPQWTGRIRGRVLLPDGQPAVEARVVAERLNTKWSSQQPPPTYPSGLGYDRANERLRGMMAHPAGANGVFEIAVQAVGQVEDEWVSQFMVDAFAEGYPSTRVGPVTCPTEGIVELAEPVVLSTGRPLVGRVTDAEGQAVEGARVACYWPNYAVGGMRWTTEEHRHGQVAHALTAADGSYQLPPLGTGTYDVWVTAADEAPTGREKLVVTTREPEELHLRFPEPSEIHGSIFYRGTTDPMPGVRVSVGLYGPRERREAVSNEEGVFALTALPAGQHDLHLIKDRYAEPPSADRKLVLGDGDIAVMELDMCRGGVVKGRVVDADGEPIEGAMVMAGHSPEEGVRVGSSVGRTDADGRFRAENLWPREYWFSTELPDGREGESETVPIEDDEEPVEVEIVIQDE